MALGVRLTVQGVSRVGHRADRINLAQMHAKSATVPTKPDSHGGLP